MSGAITAPLSEDGEVVDRGRFRTTPKAIEKWFTDVPPARVAMEAATHSIWISAQLQEMGHEVIVANVRELRAISHSARRSDQVDAEKLARYARLDSEILLPISHRTHQAAGSSDPNPCAARSASSRAVTSGVISVCDLDAVSLEVAILSSASPRPGTSICDVCWSSVPATSFDHRARTHRSTAGLHLAARGGKQARNEAVVARTSG